MLGSAESEHPVQISHEIILEVFQPVTIPQPRRRTDGQTGSLAGERPWRSGRLEELK